MNKFSRQLDESNPHADDWRPVLRALDHALEFAWYVRRTTKGEEARRKALALIERLEEVDADGDTEADAIRRRFE